MQTDAQLLDSLREQSRRIQQGIGKMSERETLTVEAYECAKRGDFDDARLRLERRDNPKWWSPRHCEDEYHAAMAAKRGAAA
jgi:hypothetical protein